MFNSRYYDRLARLKLAVDKKSNAALLGSRKSVRKGSSAEFSDFREYMPGDDIRAIDWNAYARLDRLYIKEYMEEKESRITIFLDTSRSMDYGERKKSELAKELTAALSYIALMSMDHVVIYDMADLNRRHVARGGKGGYRELMAFLDKLPVSEHAEFYRSIKGIGAMQPGLSIIISDFLDEEILNGILPDREAIQNGQQSLPVNGQDPLLQMIKYLHFMRQKVVLLQVLAQEETEISFSGTCNLIDVEDRDSRLRVTMDADVIKLYLDALHGLTAGIGERCRRVGALYHQCNTADSFDKIIFNELQDIYEFR